MRPFLACDDLVGLEQALSSLRFGCQEGPPSRKSRSLTCAACAAMRPPAVPGIVFLSGGQEHRVATAHLDEINRLPEPKPWRISFSSGALQDHALETWHVRDENLGPAAGLVPTGSLQQRRQPREIPGMRWKPNRWLPAVLRIAASGATIDINGRDLGIWLTQTGHI